jgi:hypothetical protein
MPFFYRENELLNLILKSKDNEFDAPEEKIDTYKFNKLSYTNCHEHNARFVSRGCSLLDESDVKKLITNVEFMLKDENVRLILTRFPKFNFYNFYKKIYLVGSYYIEKKSDPKKIFNLFQNHKIIGEEFIRNYEADQKKIQEETQRKGNEYVEFIKANVSTYVEEATKRLTNSINAMYDNNKNTNKIQNTSTFECREIPIQDLKQGGKKNTNRRRIYKRSSKQRRKIRKSRKVKKVKRT